MVAFSRFAATSSGGWLPKVVRCVVRAAVPAPVPQPAAAAAAGRGVPSLPGGGAWLLNLVRSGERAAVPVPVPPTTAAAGRIGVPSLPGGGGCASNSSMSGRMTTIASRSLPSITIAPGGVLIGPTRSSSDCNVRGLSILSASSKAPGGVPLGTARFSSGCNVRGLSILSTSSKASGNGGGRGLLRFVIVHCAAVASTIGLCYLVFGKKEEEFLSVDNDSTFPESLDWTLLASFPDIPDRCYNKTCGSCWACTAVKSTEAEVAIGTGKKIALSIQQVIDCAAIEGCRGGTLDQAYNYMTEAGITTEKAYPGPPGDARSLLYGIFPGYCQMKGKPVAVRIGGYIRIPATERSFISALQSGPIAVYVNVNKAFAQLGPDKVLEVEMCPPFAVKPEAAHCVLLVGYGTDELGGRYWKVLNSWGPGWGKGSYGKLRRGTHPLGVAGITEYAGFRPVSVELVDLP